MVSPRGFADGQTVWIEQHGELTKAIIRHSTQLGGNYLLGLGTRISILTLVRRQYTPALPRIPRLSALNPAHHLRR